MSTAAVLDSRTSATSESDWIFTEADDRSSSVNSKAWVKFVDEHVGAVTNVVLMRLQSRIGASLSADDPDLLAGYSGEDSDPELSEDISAAMIGEVEA